MNAYFLQAEVRSVVAQGHLCDEHVPAFLHAYWESTDAAWPGTRFRNENGVCFDPGLVFLHDGPDERGPLDLMCLVELGGIRRFRIAIGRFEAQSLALELQGHVAERPVPHRAMVALIEALRGRLLHIVVDKYHPAQEVVYEAKLHVQQMDKVLIVDARPSDAITMAVICGVPIYVSDAILAALPGLQR